MFALFNDTFGIKAMNQYINGKKSTLYILLIYNVTSYRIHEIPSLILISQKRFSEFICVMGLFTMNKK